MKTLVLIILLLVSLPARADPVTAFLVTVGFSATTAAAITGALISIGLSLVSKLLFSSSTSTPSINEDALGRTQIVRSSVAERRVIYGEIKTSGVLVFAATSGSRNKDLHLVIVLATHEVESIGTVYFNDRPSSAVDRKWYTIEKHLGGDNQRASQALVNVRRGWSHEHRLRGIAYLYIKLVWDKGNKDADYTQLAWPNGIPNISAIVKGKKVFDPRTNTTGYSNNWALCVADYLVDTKWGMATPPDEVDWNSVTTAANISDEAVQTTRSASQPRYRLNGSFVVDERPLEKLEAFELAAAAQIIWTGGEWVLYAGAATPATMDLTVDNLRGELVYQARTGRRSLFNAVRGTYIDPDSNWLPTDFPVVKNELYEDEDGGNVIYRDISLPFITDSATAQRLAKINLEESRQAITVAFPGKIELIALKPWQVVTLTVAHLGWERKKFRVIAIELTQDYGVDIELKEYADQTYAWNFGEATRVDPAPNTSLADGTTVPRPLTLTLEDGVGVNHAGVVNSYLLITWAIGEGILTTGYDLQYKYSDSDSWLDIGRAAGLSYRLEPIIDQRTIDVRVRAISVLGNSSEWTYLHNYYVAGKTAPPAEVQGFLVKVAADGTRLFYWQENTEADIAGYRISYTRAGAEIATLKPAHNGLLTSSPWETALIEKGDWQIGIAAVDTSGNASALTFIIATLSDTRQADILFDHNPRSSGWPKTKSNRDILALDESLIVGATPDDPNGVLVGNPTHINDVWFPDYTTDGDGNVFVDLTWGEDAMWGGQGSTNNTAYDIFYRSPWFNFQTMIAGTININADISGGALAKSIIHYRMSETADLQSLTVLAGQSTSRLLFSSIRYEVYVESDDVSAILAINDLQFAINGSTSTDSIEDLDTSSLAGTAAAGRVIETDLSIVSQVQIALQSVGAGWTWEIVNKAPPTIKIYDADGVAADAIIDVFMRGVA